MLESEIIALIEKKISDGNQSRKMMGFQFAEFTFSEVVSYHVEQLKELLSELKESHA